MKAREMFEKLGYTIEIRNCFIEYCIKGQDPFHYKRVFFDLVNEMVTADCNLNAMNIDMPTLKAINKQCEELRWLGGLE